MALYKYVCNNYYHFIFLLIAFSALTLLVGWAAGRASGL